MLCVAFALFVFSAAASAAQLFGKVVAVADGDTLTLLDTSHARHKIRLSGIDAPERRQPYGQDAKHHLSVLIYGQWVLVTWGKRDRYGRIVGRVLGAACARPECPHTVDVGLEQMKAGLAWHYKQYEREQSPPDRARYAAVEEEARARGIGLWRELASVPPWEFRVAARHRPRAKIASIDVSSKGDAPMTLRNAICAATLLLGALASAPAVAHGVRFGFNFGFPVFPYYYPPPPVYYYPPPVVTVPAPQQPVYVERSDAQSAAAPPPDSYWYYCPDSKTYYPYVSECASQWQPVSPRPPGM